MVLMPGSQFGLQGHLHYGRRSGREDVFRRGRCFTSSETTLFVANDGWCAFEKFVLVNRWNSMYFEDFSSELLYVRYSVRGMGCL